MGTRIVVAIAIVSFFFVSAAAAPDFETFHVEYSSFDEGHRNVFAFEKPATVNNGALQVTPDSASADYNYTHQSGRILLKRSFKLWDGGSEEPVASFNSSFLINIYRPFNETPGEGLAFLIAPNMVLPLNSNGQFLGLVNSSTNGNITNKIVAVEIDTFKQDFDPDDNHVGIDINSVNSVRTESLARYNITIAPIGARFFNIWVDYDGSSKVMEVYIAEQAAKTGPTPNKPRSPILWYNLNLRNLVNQYSYFGFSASTGSNIQLNCVLRWNFTVQYFRDDNSKWFKIGLGAGVPVVVLLLMCISLLAYFLYRQRQALSNPNLVEKLKSLPGTPQEFRFRDLKTATGNFDEKNKLGQGGYGVVYRGLLAKENLEIAVKCFPRASIKGQDDFLAELTIINRLRHKLLVKLLGWCYENGKLLIVYEYMPNGSLDKHLFSSSNEEPLNWDRRYNIASDVASALNHLHNGSEQLVVHRDLKASNIMLTSNFDARLGDFGLARALENEKTSYAEPQGVLGTMGYIALECFHTGKATKRSDVYALGAVLLELVCGHPPGTNIGGFRFLVDWVWFLHRDGRLLEAVDPRLGDNYDPEEARRLLLLGLACLHPSASERPKTEDIVQMILSKTMDLPYVPPFRPAFVWPSAEPMHLDSNSFQTTVDITSPGDSGWSHQDHRSGSPV